jgi:hypothetical protein
MADGDYKDRLKPLLMMDLEKQPKNLLVYNYFPKMSDDFMNLLKSNHAKVLSIWETDFPRHSSEMSLEGYSVLKVPYKLMGEADSEGYYYISDNFFRGENAEIIREGLQADVQSYQKSLEFLLKESQEITQLEKSRSRDAKRSKGQVQHVAPVKTQSGHTASDVKRGLENTRADLKLLQTTVIPLSNQLIQFVEQGGDLQQRFDQWNNRPDMIKNFRHLMTYLDEPTPSLPMAFSASVEQFKYDQFGADIGEGVETVMDYEDLSKQQLISISAYVRSNQARHFLFVGAFAFPVSEEFAQAQGFVDSILNDKIRVMLQYYKMVASFDVEVGDKKVGSDSAMVSKNPEPTGGVDFAALNQMFGEQNSQLSAVDLGMDREKAWFGVKPIVISIDVVKDLDDFFNGQHIPKPAGPQFSAVSDIVGIKNW